MKPIAVLYARSSTVKQENSVPDQISSLLRWNEKNLGAEIVKEFSDEGVSGSIFNARPGFQEMLRFCTNGNKLSGEKYILVESLDRFGRPDDPRQAAAFEWKLVEAGWKIVEISEGLIEENAGHEILRTIKRQQAGQFLRDLAAKIARGQHAAMKERGVHMGRPPYGYAIEVRDGNGDVLKVCKRGESPPRGKGYASNLVLGDPFEILTVKRIFHAYAFGKGNMRIARELNQDGIPSPTRQEWSRHGVKNILLNPVYGGALVLNRRGSGKFVAILSHGGEKLKRRPGSEEREYYKKSKEDWFEIPRPDLAIIPAELFSKCRAVAFEKTKNRQVIRASSRIVYHAAGVLRCRKCGAPMQGMTRNNKKWQVYCCGSYRRGKGCRPYLVPLKAFHEWVFKLIGDAFRSFPSEEEVLAILSEREVHGVDSGELEKALSAKKKETLKFADAVLDSSGAIALRARERLLRVEREIEAIEVSLSENRLRSPDKLREKAREIVAQAEEVENVLQRAEPREVRALLMSLGLVFWRESTKNVVTLEVNAEGTSHSMGSILMSSTSDKSLAQFTWTTKKGAG